MRILPNKKELIILCIIFVIVSPLIFNKGNIFLTNPFLDKYLFKIGYPIGFIITVASLFSKIIRDILFSQINSFAIKATFLLLYFLFIPLVLPAYIGMSIDTVTNIVSNKKYESIVTVSRVSDYRISSLRRKTCLLGLQIYDMIGKEGYICVLPKFYGESLVNYNDVFTIGDKLRIVGRQSVLGIAVDKLDKMNE